MIHNDLIIPSINIIHTAVVLRLNLLVPVAQHFKTTARGVFEDDIVSSAYDDDIKKKNYILYVDFLLFGSIRIKVVGCVRQYFDGTLSSFQPTKHRLSEILNEDIW